MKIQNLISNTFRYRHVGVQKLIELLFLGALLASCGTRQPQLNSSSTVNDYCRLVGNDPNQSVSEIFNTYGTPDKISVEPIPNKHSKQSIDKLHTGSFVDGNVQIYSVTAFNRNHLTKVTLTSSFWPSRLPKLIGLSQGDIIDELGIPPETFGQAFRYRCGLKEHFGLEDNYFVDIIFEGTLANEIVVVSWID